MSPNVLTVLYLVAGVLFVLSLGGLSRQETARRGNLYGLIGMVLAIGATLVHPSMNAWGLSAGGVIGGGLIGAVLAQRVAMTAMPELVAILHSFVGLAAVLVGISSYLAPGHELHGAEKIVHMVEIWLGVAIGAVTGHIEPSAHLVYYHQGEADAVLEVQTQIAREAARVLDQWLNQAPAPAATPTDPSTTGPRPL